MPPMNDTSVPDWPFMMISQLLCTETARRIDLRFVNVPVMDSSLAVHAPAAPDATPVTRPVPAMTGRAPCGSPVTAHVSAMAHGARP
eukprot:gene6635-1039_t